MTSVPNSHLDLLQDHVRAYAYLATLMPDGSPRVTPVWFNMDGDEFLINTARGRTKDSNMRARPEVALLIADPQDPMRYLQVRGRISESMEAGGLEHVNALSLKYRGKPWIPVAGQIRVIYRLVPTHISVS